MDEEQNAAVEITENGPYLVSGSVPLRRREPIVSEHGEPLTWKTGDVINDGPAYALCRCGGSSNKPYCDGTHAKKGFDGAETASTTDYTDAAKSLGGEGIEIRDDRAICAHAGFCGNQVTNVWEMAEKTGDTRVRAQAMSMIERCPSGALSYAVDGDAVEPDLPTAISLITNGPLFVTGDVTVTRSDGEVVEGRNRRTLCRCGQSSNKPLCDGSHADAGFVG